jgi:signal peptidase I
MPHEPDASGSAPPTSRRRRWRELLSVAALVLTLAAARSSLADHYVVPTGSMLPTVELQDRIVVNKVAYGVRLPFSAGILTRFEDPARGDVVVLDSPEDDTVLLKRVVAVPGDEVEVTGGRLRINGGSAPLLEQGGHLVEALGRSPHPVRLTAGGGPPLPPTRLGPDEYLVLGDNRGESHDGRSFGLVDRRAIRGKALGVFLRGGRPTWRGL